MISMYLDDFNDIHDKKNSSETSQDMVDYAKDNHSNIHKQSC